MERSIVRNVTIPLGRIGSSAAVARWRTAAHELGHVWIFTHFPYLQTEELANEIALRVVTRDTMKHVYSRLWARTGVAGNLDELLGPEPRPDGVKTAVSLQ